MKLFSISLLCCAIFTVAQAAEQGSEATLKELNGKVLMNKGNGLISGNIGAELKDGDRIVTLDKSGAKIVFNDGCTVTLEENKIFVIDARLGCKGLPIANSPAAGPVAGLSTTQGLLISAAFVGGGAIIGNAASNNSKYYNRPISSQ